MLNRRSLDLTRIVRLTWFVSLVVILMLAFDATATVVHSLSGAQATIQGLHCDLRQLQNVRCELDYSYPPPRYIDRNTGQLLWTLDQER